MTETGDFGAVDAFQTQYADALRAYLDTRDENSLAVGHEFGRRALQEQISILDIIENHFRLLDEISPNPWSDRSVALEFLLQTLAALDVATRGFLDGTKRYEEQRARARGSRAPRQVPQRPGELVTGRVLRRRP